MSNLILKAERSVPVQGMEGVVFRDARYGPVEVVQVVNEEVSPSRWLVSLWVKPADGDKKVFLEGCEADLAFLLQSFEARDEAVA